MSKRTWTGNATAVAQVDAATPGGTIEAGDLFVLTLTDESGATQVLSVIASGTTVATTCADITTAWNASTLSMFARVTAVNNTTYVGLTADTAGTPFYLACTTTESGGGAADGQTFARLSMTPSSGPSDWNVQANWVENTVPVAADDVLLTGSTSILYGLDQNGFTLGQFSTDVNFRGNIGLAGAPLSIEPTSCRVNGGGTMYTNLNGAAIAATVAGGTRLSLNGSAMTTVTAEAGTLLLGVDPGDTPTLATLYVRQGATATVGYGATITAYKQSGGTGNLHVGATTVEIQSGTLTTYSTGAITTLSNDGGTLNCNSTGTITTLNANGGTTDFTLSRAPRAVTTLNQKKSATVKFDSTVVTVTTYAPSGLLSLAAN